MDKQNLVIRPIQAGDIGAVQDFLFTQLQELFNQDGQAAITDDVWGLGKTYLEPDNCNMWAVFTPEGAVVGTAAICAYNGRIEVLKGRYDLSTTAEVGRCYIDARLRRQGIGSKLVEAMTAFCREHGYRTMYLHTHHFLPGGFHFWKKQGFVVTLDQGGSLEIVHMEKNV